MGRDGDAASHGAEQSKRGQVLSPHRKTVDRVAFDRHETIVLVLEDDREPEPHRPARARDLRALQIEDDHDIEWIGPVPGLEELERPGIGPEAVQPSDRKYRPVVDWNVGVK